MSEIGPHERMKGAVWGQFIGDAAALGSHWIYKQQEMAKAYPDGVHGFETPGPEHYHVGKQPGDFTHYGDAALVLLETIEQNGSFDHAAFGEAFVDSFADDSYDGYIDRATKETLRLPPWRERFCLHKRISLSGYPVARNSGRSPYHKSAE